MNPPEKLVVIKNKHRYSTATATLLAGNDWWDGNNFERYGRNTFLYRTPHSRYFVVYVSRWQGEHTTLEPISQQEAIELYEGRLCEHRVEFEEAFPVVTVEEA